MSTDDQNNVATLHEAKLEKMRQAIQRDLGGVDDDIIRVINETDPCLPMWGVEAGRWREEGQYGADGEPLNMPVVPLGYDNDVFFFLNVRGTITALTANAGRGHIDALFAGASNYVIWAWPKMIKARGEKAGDKPSGNYHLDDARRQLFDICMRKGPWNATEKIRGRGAWRGEDGGLILHLGATLWVGGTEIAAGALGEYVYAKRPPIARPKDMVANPGLAIRQLFDHWNFARDFDADLLLGWFGAAQLGGALDRRPIAYLTGDKGTGKSTLQELIGDLLGPGHVKTSDTTRAGIDQMIQTDALPVMVDEMEAKADTRKATAILELARTAYDGALTLRGGADHTVREFRARSCFLMASINPPSMMPQDRSRMCVMELLALGKDAREPKADKAHLAALGRSLLHRLATRWRDLPETMDRFTAALKAAGHDGRGATTWGTLAAFSHLALRDHLPEALDLQEWADRLDPTELAEFETTTHDWQDCLTHLMTQPVEMWRGKYKELTVAEVLLKWTVHLKKQAWRTGLDGTEPEGDGLTEEEVRQRLSTIGLSLIVPKRVGAPDPAQARLFVMNAQPGLFRLFAGSPWAGVPGGTGVWVSALRKMPAAYYEKGTAKVPGVGAVRGTKINLDVALPDIKGDG